MTKLSIDTKIIHEIVKQVVQYKETTILCFRTFLQIAERIEDEIIQGIYIEDSRIPSVREYAMLVEVNANPTRYISQDK